MDRPRRRRVAYEPLRGAGYVLLLGGAVLLAATVIAAALIWLMR